MRLKRVMLALVVLTRADSVVRASQEAAMGDVATVRAELASCRLDAGAKQLAHETEVKALRERIDQLEAENARLVREAKLAETDDCEARLERAVAAALSGPDVEARIDAAREDGAVTTRAQLESEEAAAVERAVVEAVDAAMAEREAQHQRLFDKYVEEVTRRHEEAVAREVAARDAECEREVLAERRAAEKELRIARKESGWESEMDSRVRAAVKERLDVEREEAEARCEAKHRGKQYDCERELREEIERLQREWEAHELAAVANALATARADTERRVAATREEADLRCQYALEIVLEGAAAGEDMKRVRALAERASQPSEAEAPPPVPVPVPVPVTRPVEAPR